MNSPRLHDSGADASGPQRNGVRERFNALIQGASDSDERDRLERLKSRALFPHAKDGND